MDIKNDEFENFKNRIDFFKKIFEEQTVFYELHFQST
jgi:hypothetical protein